MYTIKRMWLDRDSKSYQEWLNLLKASGLQGDDHVDFTLGVFHQDKLIATGSIYKNIIKCVAVSSDYQQENLLTQLVVALTDKLFEQQIHHFFLYTKVAAATSFAASGFKEVARTNDLVFMEQGTPDFQEYLAFLKKHKRTSANAGAIVMNANPFTKGHLHLVEQSSAYCDVVYLFVLSEDRSEFSTAERISLVKAGTQHLSNVVVLPTRDYQVSSATFPSYFLKDRAEANIASVQARLDAQVFKDHIAPALDIHVRFVGEEPFSPVTNIYNQSMQSVFGSQLQLMILPRLTVDGEVISATNVRKALNKQDFDKLSQLVPATTYHYLLTNYGKKHSRGEKIGN